MKPLSIFLKCIFIVFFSAICSCKSNQVRTTDKKIGEILENNIKVDDDEYIKVLAKEKLNVHDLYILAMSYSEKIAIAGENVIQSREKIRQAWGAIMPSVSFRMSLYAPDNSFGGNTGSSGFTRGFRFYARQNLLTGLDEISGLRGGTFQEEYSISQLKAEANLLYDQIAQVFFEYLVLEDSLNTQKILLDNSSDLKKELEKRFNLGKVRRSEILSIEVMIAKTETLIINLHTQLSNAQKRIRDLTGLSTIGKYFIPDKPVDENNDDFTVQTDFSENDASDILKRKLEGRPDIMSLKTNWELAKLESSRALGGHLPRIYLEGSYRLPEAGSTVNDYYGAIIAEVPLFSGGIIHSQYRVARSRERQAELRYNEALRLAKDELVYYIHSWKSGERAVEMLRIAREKAENNYKTILSDYRIGQATNLEVLSALNEAASVKEEFEKTRLNQMLTKIHINILTGELPSKK